MIFATEALQIQQGPWLASKRFFSVCVCAECLCLNPVVALREVEECVSGGGSFRHQCTNEEEEVPGSCSSSHFCCCIPKDS